MDKTFIPKYGEEYYYVNQGHSSWRENDGDLIDDINIELGNCFHNRGQAIANVAVVMKRVEKAKNLLKQCQEE